MICQRCGAALAPASQFCSTCGTPIAAAPPPIPGAPPPLPAVGAAGPAGWAPPPAPPPPAYGAPPSFAPAAPAAPVDAGFWLRFGASMLDGLIVGFVSWIVMAVVIGVAAVRSQGDKDPSGILGAVFFAYVLVIGLCWLYFALQEAGSSHATLGKRACGLAAVDLEGAPIGFGRASGRFFGKFVSSLVPFGLGYFMAGFTQRKQALHDMIAGTRVVRTRQGGGGAAVVVAVVAGLFVVVAIVGILAAIAIPNFIRFQLRAKASEGKANVAEIVKAEQAYAEQNGHFMGLSVPEGPPGREKLAWSAEDQQAASAIDWQVAAGTYFTYRVAAGVTDAGKPAFAVCAESDLDADGQVAAVVAFVPGEDSTGTLLAPEAPCQHQPALEPGRSLSFTTGDPVGMAIQVSPDNVF